MQLVINLIPLIIILVALFMRKHMLFAGLAGGIIAMIIGGISISAASGLVMEGIGKMFSYVSPILYAAAAVMVSKGGSIQALVDIAERRLKGKIAFFAGFLVLVQSFATYMAGMGAGNTMVIAPLVAAAVGAVPEVIAGMAIATAVGFTTSPASTETILAAESAGRDVVEHAAAMGPVTIIFFLLGAALATYGVYKRGTLVEKKEKADGEEIPMSKLFVRAIPACALLIMVVFSSNINSLLGFKLLTPAVAVAITAVLTVCLTPLGLNKTCDALVDGSRYILTTLFGVGIFLSFINIIAELGTFEQLAALVGNVPTAIIVPCAIIMAFLIAIPSGAFCAGVLTLILPTLALLGMPSEAMGFVAIAAGLGTQISPVQINIAALSEGFKVDIMDICKKNTKFLVSALAVLIVLSFIFVR